MSSTITLQTVTNLASTHVELLPLSGVGGYTSEPALSLCNNVIQELLSAPLDWKWNRAEMNLFVLTPNKQDYLFAGAAAFTLGGNPQGAAVGLVATPGISRTGTTVTVTTLENHYFSVGDTVYMFGNADTQFNSTFTQNGTTSTYSGGWVITAVTATTFTFTHATSGSTTSGASGITDFGWLAGGTMIGVMNNSAILPTRHVEAVRDLQPYGFASTPEKVCVVQDLNTGVLKLRFYPVPGSTIWGVNLVYQKKAPLATALSGTWSPIPDELSYVYRQGFLAQAYRYINSPRSEVENQKFQAAIMKALGADDRETSDRHLYPEVGIMTSLDYFGIL